MTSEFTKSDLDTLLSMEMKLRLLDLENIQIPEAPPPIPKEPSNYDFVYDCNWLQNKTNTHWTNVPFFLFSEKLLLEVLNKQTKNNF